MADDQSQRPYRASEPPVRSAAKPSGNDPLAELARLIGQTDPFAEFGRESARRASTPQPGERSDWDTQPLGSPFTSQAGAASRAPAAPQILGGSNSYFPARPEPADQPIGAPQNYASQNYGRQSYAGAPLPHADEDHQAEQGAHGYPADQVGYEQDGYEHGAHQQLDEEYYEDAPPSRRRLGIMAIVGVFALAVIGTAGAFGYRALFGSSGSTQPPPVIKADAGPSKVVPATTGKDAQSNKLITDRMNERGQSEKLVSREEQPIDKPAMAASPSPLRRRRSGAAWSPVKPKKIRTIAIRPDQSATADAMPSSPLGAAAAPARAVAAPPPQGPAPRAAPPLARASADTATVDAEERPQAPPARAAAPVRQAAPAAGSNAPLSLNCSNAGRARLRPPRPRGPLRSRRMPQPAAPIRAGRAATSRCRRNGANPKRRRPSAPCRQSSRANSAADSRWSTKSIWEPRGRITGPWSGRLRPPTRPQNCVRASRRLAGSASSRGINRPKLDPCGGRGLIRADGGTRIYHRVGGATVSADERAFSARPSPGALIIFKRNVSTPIK